MNNLKTDDLLNNFYDLVNKKTREYCEKEKDHRQDKLESFENYCARQEHASAEMAKAYIEGCAQVFQVIIGELLAANEQQAIKELIEGAEHFIASMPDESKMEDKILGELFGYNTELMEKVYQVGLTCLERGHVVDASKVFGFLILLDPGFSACWTMLGVALKMEKHWNQSLEALEMAIKIDEHNPLAYLHVATCYRELGRRQEAREALKKSLSEILAHPEYADLEKIIRFEQSCLSEK